MILIDPRNGNEKNNIDTAQVLVDHIRKLGIKSDKASLEFGDAAFEGNGPQGTVAVGIERKTLHDILNCIDDARLTGHQLVGMKQMYSVRVVLLEGHWRPHDGTGVLMEGFNGGTSWGYCKYRSQRTMYNKLYRYLISVSLSGAIVTYSRDLWHTAFNICEWYHYFQKRWDDHTALREVSRVQIPTFNARPSLKRRWAYDLEGVGVKTSELAERHFKTPLALANADESEWLRIPGVGVRTAQSIVREIWGLK